MLMFGGPGTDYITGGGGNDVLVRRQGFDRLNGGVGDDYVNGNAGPDVLEGGQRADRLFGGTDDVEIDSRDDEADGAGCTDGVDLARVDEVLDGVAKNCERVRAN